MGTGTWSGRVLRSALVIITIFAVLLNFFILLTQRLTPDLSLRYLLNDAGENKVIELRLSREHVLSDLQVGLSARVARYGKGAWSSDGHRLAFEVIRVDRETGIYDDVVTLWLLDLDTGNLESLDDTSGWFASLNWSADNRYLAYTTHSSSSRYLAYTTHSSSSRYLAYTTHSSRSIQLVDTLPSLHFDTSSLPENLTKNLGTVSLPTWSPVEPGVLAFLVSLADHDELVLIDLYNARRFDVQETHGPVRQILWLPGGEGLYLQLNAHQSQHISDFRVETDESLFSQQNRDEIMGTVYAYSPDATRVAYASLSGEGVYLTENGRAPRLLARAERGGIIQDLAWDDTGQILVFSEARSGTCQFFIVDVARGLVVKPFSAQFGVCRRHPVWVSS